jgi:hypothetical protein
MIGPLRFHWHFSIFTFMELEARKHQLIQWLARLKDIQVVQALESIMASQETQREERFWDELTPEQSAGLDLAIESMNRGEFISFEQLRANIKEKHGV